MDKLTLISSLGGIGSRPPTDPEQHHKIEYQSYEVDVDGTTRVVLIPMRECVEFERSLSKLHDVTGADIKQLLRQHRGIRG